VTSCHDVAEGGLLVAVAECCLAGGLGATLDLPDDEQWWFGEAPGAFVVSGDRSELERLGGRVLGVVGGDALAACGERWMLHELSAANGALAALFP